MSVCMKGRYEWHCRIMMLVGLLAREAYGSSKETFKYKHNL